MFLAIELHSVLPRKQETPMTTGGFHTASTFTRIGGARIGFINATWPLAQLSAERNAIALRCLFKFTFPRHRITRLSRYRSFMSTGLQIEHTLPRCPRFMVFWGVGFNRLKADLDALGYTVRD
jgi:hypothetical protein